MALVTEQGYKVPEAARSLDIGDNLLRRWKREFEAEASGDRLSTDEREELKRLRKAHRNPPNGGLVSSCNPSPALYKVCSQGSTSAASLLANSPSEQAPVGSAVQVTDQAYHWLVQRTLPLPGPVGRPVY